MYGSGLHDATSTTYCCRKARSQIGEKNMAGRTTTSSTAVRHVYCTNCTCSCSGKSADFLYSHVFVCARHIYLGGGYHRLHEAVRYHQAHGTDGQEREHDRGTGGTHHRAAFSLQNPLSAGE